MTSTFGGNNDDDDAAAAAVVVVGAAAGAPAAPVVIVVDAPFPASSGTDNPDSTAFALAALLALPPPFPFAVKDSYLHSYRCRFAKANFEIIMVSSNQVRSTSFSRSRLKR